MEALVTAVSVFGGHPDPFDWGQTHGSLNTKLGTHHSTGLG